MISYPRADGKQTIRRYTLQEENEDSRTVRFADFAGPLGMGLDVLLPRTKRFATSVPEEPTCRYIPTFR